MSYRVAVNCFNENVALTGPRPADDPATLAKFNLNQGLLNLADALRGDIADLRQEIQALRGEIADLRRG